MNVIKFLPVLLFAAMPFTHAGIDVGNGGDAVVCRDASGKMSAEMLDVYEARTQRNTPLDLGASELSVEEKLELAFTRMDRLDADRAKLYREGAAQFTTEAVFLREITLIDVPDSNHIVIPNNCTIEQIIVQKAPEFPEDKRFTVNKDIWNLLDNDNKVAAIIHEVVYREAIEEWRQTQSRRTRYFTGLILSNRLSTMDRAEHTATLKRVGFEVRYGGHWYKITTATHHDNGVLKFGELIVTSKDNDKFTMGENTIYLKKAEFYPNGMLKWGELGHGSENTYDKIILTVRGVSQSIWQAEVIYFHESGRLDVLKTIKKNPKIYSSFAALINGDPKQNVNGCPVGFFPVHFELLSSKKYQSTVSFFGKYLLVWESNRAPHVTYCFMPGSVAMALVNQTDWLFDRDQNLFRVKIQTHKPKRSRYWIGDIVQRMYCTLEIDENGDSKVTGCRD